MFYTVVEGIELTKAVKASHGQLEMFTISTPLSLLSFYANPSFLVKKLQRYIFKQGSEDNQWMPCETFLMDQCRGACIQEYLP